MVYRWTTGLWSTCVEECGLRADRTRTVECTKLTIYDSGVSLSEVVDDWSCIDEAPADMKGCPTLAAGTPCDDGNDEEEG